MDSQKFDNFDFISAFNDYEHRENKSQKFILTEDILDNLDNTGSGRILERQQRAAKTFFRLRPEGRISVCQCDRAPYREHPENERDVMALLSHFSEHIVDGLNTPGYDSLPKYVRQRLIQIWFHWFIFTGKCVELRYPLALDIAYGRKTLNVVKPSKKHSIDWRFNFVNCFIKSYWPSHILSDISRPYSRTPILRFPQKIAESQGFGDTIIGGVCVSVAGMLWGGLVTAARVVKEVTMYPFHQFRKYISRQAALAVAHTIISGAVNFSQTIYDYVMSIVAKLSAFAKVHPRIADAATNFVKLLSLVSVIIFSYYTKHTLLMIVGIAVAYIVFMDFIYSNAMSEADGMVFWNSTFGKLLSYATDSYVRVRKGLGTTIVEHSNAPTTVVVDRVGGPKVSDYYQMDLQPSIQDFDDVPSVQAVSEGKSELPLASILAKVMMWGMYGKPAEEIKFETFGGIRNLFAVSDDIARIFSSLFESIPSLISWTEAKISGTPVDLPEYIVRYNELEKTVNSILSEVDHAKRCSFDKEFVMSVVNTYQEILRFKDFVARSDSFSPSQKTNFAHLALKMREFYIIAMSNMSLFKKREQPLWIYLTGPPGTGKSTLIDMIAARIKALAREQNLCATAYSPADRYERKSGLEFWDAYNGQWLCTMDDVFQTKDTQMRTDTALEIIYSVNSNPYPLNMAHLDNKGNRFFESKLVITTTNVPFSLDVNRRFIRNMGISDPNALYRRIGAVVDCDQLHGRLTGSVDSVNNYTFHYYDDWWSEKSQKFSFKELTDVLFLKYVKAVSQTNVINELLTQVDWVNLKNIEPRAVSQSGDPEKDKGFNALGEELEDFGAGVGYSSDSDDDDETPLIKVKRPKKRSDCLSTLSDSDLIPLGFEVLWSLQREDGFLEKYGKSVFPARVEYCRKSNILSLFKLKQFLKQYPPMPCEESEGDVNFLGDMCDALGLLYTDETLRVVSSAAHSIPLLIARLKVSTHIKFLSDSTKAVDRSYEHAAVNLEELDLHYIYCMTQSLSGEVSEQTMLDGFQADMLRAVLPFSLVAFVTNDLKEGSPLSYPNYRNMYVKLHGDFKDSSSLIGIRYPSYEYRQLNNSFKEYQSLVAGWTRGDIVPVEHDNRTWVSIYLSKCKKDLQSKSSLRQVVQIVKWSAVIAFFGLIVAGLWLVLRAAYRVIVFAVSESDPRYQERLQRMRKKMAGVQKKNVFGSSPAVSQAADYQGHDVARAFLANNHNIIVRFPDDKMYTTQLQMIKGRVGVLARHTVRVHKEPISIEKYGSSPGQQMVRFQWKDIKVISEDESRDLMIIELPKNCNFVRDLTVHFIERDVDNFARPVRAYVDDDGNFIFKTGTSVRLGVPTIATFNKFETKLKRIYIAHGCGGGAGQCGYPYMFLEPNIQNKFFGIHIGAIGGDSIVCPLFKEDFAAIAQLEAAMVPYCLLDDQKYLDRVPNILGAEGVGVLQDSVWLPSKSSILELPFMRFSKVEEEFSCEYRPAVLKPFVDANGVIVSPLLKALGNYSTFNDPGLVNKVSINFSNIYPRSMIGRKYSMLSIEQAVFGDADRKIHPIPRNTGNGWPYVRSNTTKHDLIDFDNEIIGLELRQAVDQILELVKNGKVPDQVYVDYLKDELRISSKVLEGKTRLFSAVSLPFYIVGRMIFGHIMADLSEMNTMGPFYNGVNHNTVSTQVMKQRLSQYDKFLDGDFKNFDVSHKREFSDIIYQFFAPFFGSDNMKKQARAFIEGIYQCVHVCGNVVYRSQGSMPSGNPMTLTFNNIVNYYVHAVAFSYLCPNREFSECVQYFCGDDSLVGVPEGCENFNMITLARFLKDSFGMIYTSSDKAEQSVEFHGLNEVSFCKRKFAHVYGRDVLQLDEEVIRRIPCYTTKEGMKDVFAQTKACDTALREWFLYGKDVFDKKLKLYNKYLTKASCAQVSLTWDSLMSSFINEYNDT